MTGGGQARCLRVSKMSPHVDVCAPVCHLNFAGHVVAVSSQSCLVAPTCPGPMEQLPGAPCPRSQWLYSAVPLALFSCMLAVNATGQRDLSACRHVPTKWLAAAGAL